MFKMQYFNLVKQSRITHIIIISWLLTENLYIFSNILKNISTLALEHDAC